MGFRYPLNHLTLHTGDACEDPVFLDYDPEVCERCGIARSEHEPQNFASLPTRQGDDR